MRHSYQISMPSPRPTIIYASLHSEKTEAYLNSNDIVHPAQERHGLQWLGGDGQYVRLQGHGY